MTSSFSVKKIALAVICIFLLLLSCGCGPKMSENDGSARIDSEVMGRGEKSFTFSVTDTEGNTVTCTVRTDKNTVGQALTELNLIAGELGPYGLYVKTVTGITLDFDRDGKYWAFYEGDSSAAQGVDSTNIVNGASYSMKVQ